MADPKDTVLRFIDAVNNGSIDKIYSLMSEDHQFIDADGEQTAGREKMYDSWTRFFKIVSGYKIKYDKVIVDGENVALHGTASGTFFDNGKVLELNSWSVPASWFAVVENEQIKEWRLICNLEPAMKIYHQIKKEKN